MAGIEENMTDDLTTESNSNLSTVSSGAGAGGSGGGGGSGNHLDSRLEDVMYVYDYFASTVPWIALFCNSLSFLVFAYKLKYAKREQNVNILLAGLAVADTLSLVSAMDFGIYFWSDREYSVMQSTEPGCRGIQYVNSLARDCSSYFIVIFTIDRFVSVRFPLQKSIWITPKRVEMAMFVTFLCAAVAEIYQPYLLRFHEQWEYCYSEDHIVMGRWTMIVRGTWGFVLPGIIIAILNVLIFVQLAKWSKQRAAMTGAETHNRTLTFLLIGISTYSFLVSLPKVILLYYTETLDPYKQRPPSYYIAGFTTDGLAMLNHACNFFFYCMSGTQFRKDLLKILTRIFTCGKCEYFKLVVISSHRHASK